MFSALVNRLFLSFTGTSGYSSSTGSAVSHAQSYFASTPASSCSFSAGTQPWRQTAVSVCMSLVSASARAIFVLMVSARSFSSALCGASAAMAEASSPFSRLSSAILFSLFSAACLAVQSNSPGLMRLKPSGRSVSSAASSSSLRQTSST